MCLKTKIFLFIFFIFNIGTIYSYDSCIETINKTNYVYLEEKYFVKVIKLGNFIHNKFINKSIDVQINTLNKYINILNTFKNNNQITLDPIKKDIITLLSDQFTCKINELQ